MDQPSASPGQDYLEVEDIAISPNGRESDETLTPARSGGVGLSSHAKRVSSSPRFRGMFAGTFPRFLGTGLLNTAFGYAAYALLVLSGAPVWGAVAGATLMGITFNFFSYGGLVFGSSGLDRLPRFVAVYALVYAINVALTKLLMSWGLGPLLAQAVLVPFLAVLAFTLMRSLVYGAPSKEPAD